MTADNLTIVVPTIDRPELVDRLLRCLTDLDLGAPVVVVDQSATSDTRDVVGASALPDVRYLHTARGLSRARNRGLEAVDTDYVLFLDDDLTLDRAALTAALGGFDRDEIGFVCGRVVHPDGGARMTFATQGHAITPERAWRGVLEAATVFRVAALHSIGGFDEDLGIGSGTRFESGEGTDVLLRLLARHEGVYVPGFVLNEDEPAGGGYRTPAYLDKTLRYARGTGRVLRKNGGAPVTFGRLLLWPAVRAAICMVRGDVWGARFAGAQLRGRWSAS